MTTSIQTERLLIRNFVPDDAPALRQVILSYQSSPYAVYDHRWPTSEEGIAGAVAWFAEGDRYLAVCSREPGRFLGFVCLNPEGPAEDHTLNLGYVFGNQYHHEGYATEACLALLAHVFAGLGAERVVSATAAVNGPSCRLLDRLGFAVCGRSTIALQNDAQGRPVEFVGLHYSLTRTEWRIQEADRMGRVPDATQES